MKNDKEWMKTTKIYALKNLGAGAYRKAMPITRVDGIKFDESNFKVRFDLKTISTSPDDTLSIGDICKINNDFYVKLLLKNQSDTSPLDWNWDAYRYFEERFVIIAFVEMNSKNHCEIFCALRGVTDSEMGIMKIAETENKSLLLFWPESLEKIEE
jgi:hypothetical protein